MKQLLVQLDASKSRPSVVDRGTLKCWRLEADATEGQLILRLRAAVGAAGQSRVARLWLDANDRHLPRENESHSDRVLFLEAFLTSLDNERPKNTIPSAVIDGMRMRVLTVLEILKKNDEIYSMSVL